MQRPNPDPWILLGPSGMREGHVVALVGRRDERPIGSVKCGVRPLAAHVAANYVRPAHGSMTIFRPAPDRIVSKASPIRSRGNRWVTTAANSSRLRRR